MLFRSVHNSPTDIRFILVDKGDDGRVANQSRANKTMKTVGLVPVRASDVVKCMKFDWPCQGHAFFINL